MLKWSILIGSLSSTQELLSQSRMKIFLFYLWCSWFEIVNKMLIYYVCPFINSGQRSVVLESRELLFARTILNGEKTLGTRLATSLAIGLVHHSLACPKRSDSGERGELS